MKTYLIARNVVNLPDIDKFLISITLGNNVQKQEIKTWINKSLKDYIKNDLDTIKPVITFKKNDPDWLKDGVKNGTALKVSFNRGFRNQIAHILDYFNSLPDTELSKITRLKFDIALGKSKEWMQELHEKASIEEDFEGITTVRAYKEGYSWVRVESAKALNREGKLMKHCVGSYASKVASQQCVIYSLRDPNNKPHCTVEIIKHTINQIKGVANGAIKEKYIKYCKNFIEKPIEGEIYRKIRDLSNIGLLDQDGIWYNIYNLPENFVVNKWLHLGGASFKTLAKNLTIKGNLWLNNAKFKYLPDNLTVEGTLDLDGSTLKELPKNLIVKRHLILNNRIAELPEDLIVKGELRANKKLLYSTIPHNVNKVKFKLVNGIDNGPKSGRRRTPDVWGEFVNGELKKSKSFYDDEDEEYLYGPVEIDEHEIELQEMLEEEQRMERLEREEQRRIDREAFVEGY